MNHETSEDFKTFLAENEAKLRPQHIRLVDSAPKPYVSELLNKRHPEHEKTQIKYNYSCGEGKPYTTQ